MTVGETRLTGDLGKAVSNKELWELCAYKNTSTALLNFFQKECSFLNYTLCFYQSAEICSNATLILTCHLSIL